MINHLVVVFLAALCLRATTAENDAKEELKYTVTSELYFDVLVKDMDGPGEDYTGRFVIGVFGDIVPMTAMNVIALARGYGRGGKKLSYKNTPIHRVVPDFLIQMGDITVGDGTGGKSIYGDKFVDENFDISHKGTGIVSMANYGKDTNGSQFFILLTKARWMDGKHVAFGKVVRGFDVVHTVSEVKADSNTAVPRKKIMIVDCGVVDLPAKYTITEEQLESTEDLS